jgi:hypothetical protein
VTTDWTYGVRSQTEAEDFSSTLCVQTGSGAHPASCTVGTVGYSPGVKRGRGVMLTTHPVLVPRLRKSRSYTPCHPDAPLWSVTGPLYLYLIYIYIYIYIYVQVSCVADPSDVPFTGTVQTMSLFCAVCVKNSYTRIIMNYVSFIFSCKPMYVYYAI